MITLPKLSGDKRYNISLIFKSSNKVYNFQNVKAEKDGMYLIMYDTAIDKRYRYHKSILAQMGIEECPEIESLLIQQELEESQE